MATIPFTTPQGAKEVEFTYLHVIAGITPQNSIEVNDSKITADNSLPCMRGTEWCPLIHVDSGRIVNWKKGVKASILVKICDTGIYSALDEHQQLIVQAIHSYVPQSLAIEEEGYGDYIDLIVDESGQIKDWDTSHFGLAALLDTIETDSKDNTQEMYYYKFMAINAQQRVEQIEKEINSLKAEQAAAG